jgi:cytochrome b involved in lipid metabolism
MNNTKPRVIYYTQEEVKRHRTKDSCWIIIDNNILDVTRFLKQHPCGSDIILEHAGEDVSYIFDKVCHSNDAYKLALTYKIAELQIDK